VRILKYLERGILLNPAELARILMKMLLYYFLIYPTSLKIFNKIPTIFMIINN